jgi:hypothetical protein
VYTKAEFIALAATATYEAVVAVAVVAAAAAYEAVPCNEPVNDTAVKDPVIP